MACCQRRLGNLRELVNSCSKVLTEVNSTKNGIIYIMGIFSWSRVKHNISKYKTVQIFSPSRPLDQINGKKRTASWELFFQLHQNKQSPAPEQSRLTEGRKHCLFPVWKTMQLGFIGMEVKSFEVMSVMWVLMLKKYILWKSSLAMQME